LSLSRRPDPTREPRQDVGEVRDGIYAGKPAAAENRVGDGRPLAAYVEPGEEEVLASQSGADMQPLDGAVIHGDGAVLEKAPERDLIVGEVW
jgi:hypothetical protein